MNQLTSLTSDAKQQITVVLANGSTFSLTIYYVPLQYSWFATNLTYGSFVMNGSLRITNNANMLYFAQNILPFGLACFSSSQREPSQQLDFVSGASGLFILTQAECQALATYIAGGVLPA